MHSRQKSVGIHRSELLALNDTNPCQHVSYYGNGRSGDNQVYHGNLTAQLRKTAANMRRVRSVTMTLPL